MRNLVTVLLSLLFLSAVAEEWIFEEECDAPGTLAHDLMIVDWVNTKNSDRMPVTFNHFLQGGYINMPSARMACEGDIGAGFAYVPPYRVYSARAQITPYVEVTGNYRVFRGVEDPVLSQYGFGDFSDKGANVKFALLHPEESGYCLPGVAFGFDDFLGTRAFKSAYIVMTKVFLEKDLELSIGIGRDRIRGLFGGALWMPFRRSCRPCLEGLAFALEYDATPYESESIEPHPDGRVKRTPFNFGVKYRMRDYLEFSASYIRGDAFAFAASASYNLGMTQGLFPKIDDPLPYRSPVVTEPLGCMRPVPSMVQDLLYPFCQQGFTLLGAWLTTDDCGNKRLRLKIYNCYYRYESQVRCRLNYLLANLIPEDITHVNVVIEADGIPSHEYRYTMEYVRAFMDQRMGAYELEMLSPMANVTYPPCPSLTIYSQRRERCNVEILPKITTFFGSATGKWKGSYGLYFGVNGYLFSDLYYSLLVGWTWFSDLYDVRDVDRLNPSQVINVRTDGVNYQKGAALHVEEAYLQKCWHICGGWYGRASVGLFELAYGGAAGELLYYPVGSAWAFGVEGAHLRKRTYDGLGFSDEVRRLNGFEPVYEKFNGYQYFANLYYHMDCVEMDFHVQAGKFLAHDTGVRYEVSKYFPSGLRWYMWYTRTDKRDYVNGERYYDKGVAISFPLDIFYTNSCRNRHYYGMSAWLRDVGQQAFTGRRLYELLFGMRE